MINLLFITGKLDYVNGVTSHLFNLIRELKRDRNFSISVLCTGGDSIERFSKLNINIIEDELFDHQVRSFKNYSVAVKRLIKIIRNNSINIIHSHNHYAANISYYASKLTGAYTVQTIHGIIPEEGILIHFRAHKYVSVSEEGEKYLLDNKISGPENIFFINQGLELIGPLIKKKRDLPQIICASRLVMEKGVDLFIRAAKIVKDNSDTEPAFFIAGTGEYETKLKDLNNEINAGVTFLGKSTHLAEVLKDMDIFVMPTRSSSEGFPMSVVEAAFTGNLIIISEFGNFKNIFSNNEDGYTFKVNDHIELADKILLAINHPDRSAELAERFRKKSEVLFSIKTMARKHTEVYKSCLKH